MEENQRTNGSNNTGLWLGAGILGTLLVGGIIYANIDKITGAVTETVENNLGFEVNKVRFVPGYPFIVLPIDFDLINENLIGATDVTFSGKAYYEGTKVADILEVSIIDIPADSIVTGTVEAIVDLRNLKARAIEIFSNGRFTKQLEIRGKIGSSFGEFEVSRKIDVEV